MTHSGPVLGDGKVIVLWDDAKGRRTQLNKAVSLAGIKPGASLTTVDAAKLPKGARVVVIAWSGVDASGEPLVMGGRIKLP